MSTLGKHWFIADTTDFEYKKYLLLAYLQQVTQAFKGEKIHPHLHELKQHFLELKNYKERKETLSQNLYGTLSGFDLKHWRLLYEKTAEDNDALQEVERLIYYAMPLLQDKLKEGNALFSALMQLVQFDVIGILPSYKDEGYLLLKNGEYSSTKVYAYRISFYESVSDTHKSIRWVPVQEYPRSLLYTPAYIKSDLIKQQGHLPNPATWYFYTAHPLPEEEALLPISVHYLSGQLE